MKEGWDQRYGFRFGAASVQRLVHADKWGVMIAVVTPRKVVEIRVTPSGLIRIGKQRKPYEHETQEWSKP